MDSKEWIEERNGWIRITVRVQPRASRDEIAGVHGGALKVRLTSPPVDGAANARLIRFLADRLGVPRSKVTIVTGDRSKRKSLKIEGLSMKEVLDALGIV